MEKLVAMGKYHAKYLRSVLMILVVCACQEEYQKVVESSQVQERTLSVEEFSDKNEVATLAGGCFWCMEAPFEGIDGIRTVTSGFSGGDEQNPTYEQVSAGSTGHREVVQITFNPEVISYMEILDVYWKQFDPTDGEGSFTDRGFQYSPAVFAHTPTQKEVAEASKEALMASGIFGAPILTPILPYRGFYRAKEYHQDFYRKEPFTYRNYRIESGRDEFIAKFWEVPKAENYLRPDSLKLLETLSFVQYGVTMNNETESPFDNAYWDNTEDGIYVCIISGAPLFSSVDQYDSGTGWPSFSRPIDTRFLKKQICEFTGYAEIRIRSLYGDSHLGSSYFQGPEPNNIRYCINSAALKFIPLAEMYGTNYERYVWRVE
ncbi:MAG: peptide-methionine (S)-S-oxide reductase MsrA [Bacteroidota bacterium]